MRAQLKQPVFNFHAGEGEPTTVVSSDGFQERLERVAKTEVGSIISLCAADVRQFRELFALERHASSIIEEALLRLSSDERRLLIAMRADTRRFILDRYFEQANMWTPQTLALRLGRDLQMKDLKDRVKKREPYWWNN